MDIDIKLHKDDLPEDLNLGKSIAIDGEFGGLNPFKDRIRATAGRENLGKPQKNYEKQRKVTEKK